ncbi:hypothetical protein M404DRAFT_723180 [Pisolithus tinctorius Marx 270]|uniref:Uncharacterized protein n=1 Tax=Pisolithus tinctorius Marx 270 TaxID=870435 RepID=A0A0C3NL39_PISTI|nr:hypothetical protein M404DRAFT_723180 [Pisolithus tinctorius Marx 270]
MNVQRSTLNVASSQPCRTRTCQRIMTWFAEVAGLNGYLRSSKEDLVFCCSPSKLRDEPAQSDTRLLLCLVGYEVLIYSWGRIGLHLLQLSKIQAPRVRKLQGSAAHPNAFQIPGMNILAPLASGFSLVPTRTLQKMQSTTAADFLRLVQIARLTRICQLVPSVVMVYDYLISVDQEVPVLQLHKVVCNCNGDP